MADGSRLHARLREAREANGLSQTQVARAMRDEGFGWHQTTVGKVELGQRRVSLEEAVTLARILGLEPADVAEAAVADGDPGLSESDALRYARVMFAVADKRAVELEQELAAARALRAERLKILKRLGG